MRNQHLLVLGAWLFLLPNVIFATSLSWPARLVLLGGCLGSAVLLARGGRADGLLAEPARLGVLAACQAAALVVVILGGEGHLVYANSDWLWRDAVLADLSRAHELPVYGVAGIPYLLRAPLGMYMIPGAAGGLIGLPAAHFVLVLQNAALLGVILYGFWLLAPRRPIVVIAAMLAFSGLDIVGYWLPHVGRSTPSWTTLPSHLETWAPYWQYSSTVTQFFWAPNHALPGWWMALLALLCAKGEISVAKLGLSVASILIWSPLAAVGAAPFVLLQFARRPLANARDPALWAHFIVALLFLPVAVYLVVQSGTIAHSVLTTHQAFWAPYAIFLVVELLLGILALFFFRQYEPDVRPTLLLSLAVLAVLPLVRFGPANDLAMRASIPALAILAYAFGRLMAQGPSYRKPLWLFAAAMAGVAAVTPAFELARPMVFHRYAISDCSLVSAQLNFSPSLVSPNYMARADAFPPWLIAPREGQQVAPEHRDCWPDYPFDPRLFVGDHTAATLLQSQGRR